MEAPNTQQEKYQGKPRKAKRWLKVLLVAVGILILLKIIVILLIPSLVSSGKVRQMILAKANRSMDGKVDFATLSMGWFKGIEVRDISFEDKAKSISVAVKQVATMPHYAALLTGGISFGRTVIDEPRIQLNIAEPQKGQGGATTKIAAQATTGEKKAQGVGLPVGSIDLVVNNGDVKVSKGGQTVELAQVNSRVNLRPSGEQSDFDLSATVKDGVKESPVSIKGQVKSGKAGWTMEQTTGNVAIDINGLDLSSLGGLLAMAGVDIKAKGVVSANLSGAVKEGKLEKAEGAISGAGLEVTGAALKGDTIRTSTLEGAVRLTGEADLINIDALRVKSDWIKAEASGVMPTTAGSLEEFVKPDSKYELKADFACDIPAVLAQLPHTLGLKPDMKITGGKLSGNVQTLTEQGQKKLEGKVTLAGLAGSVDGKTVSLSAPVNAEVKIAADGKVVRFDNVTLTSSFADVKCSGTTEEVKYGGNVDLGKLQAELGQFLNVGKFTMAGALTSEGHLSAKQDKFAAAGSATLQNFTMTSPDGIRIAEPAANLAFDVGMDRKTSVASIKMLDVKTTMGQVALKNAMVPLAATSSGSIRADLSVNKIDLSKAAGYAAMFGAMPKDVEVGGALDGVLGVNGEKGTYRITTDSMKITNLRIAKAGEQPFVQSEVSIALDAQVNPEKQTYSIRKMELTSPDIKAKVDFTKGVDGQTANVQGKAELDYDWKAITGMLSPFMPAGLTLEGKRKDTITIASRYRTGDSNDMLANLNAQGRVGFDRAGYMGLEVGKSNVDINVVWGKLTIAPFSTTVNNGQLSFGGQADFRQKPSVFKLAGSPEIIRNVQITDKMSQQLLMYVNPIFADAVGVSGTVNLSCDRLAIPLQGGGKGDIDIAGAIDMNNVRLQPKGLLGQLVSAMGMQSGGTEVLKIHKTQFSVQKGVVRYDDMRMDVAGKPLVFKGTVGLDGRLDMNVTLPLSIKGQILGTGTGAESRPVTVPLGGTIRSPKLDVGKFLQEQAVQTGLELLLEGALKK